jgi:hypothetical protein
MKRQLADLAPTVGLSLLILCAVNVAEAIESEPMRPTYRISKGTEHKIWMNPGGATACFDIVSATTNQPARVHFRRTRAGRNKDLNIHTGHACWDAKFPVYVLYATAVDEDVIVTQTSGPP